MKIYRCDKCHADFDDPEKVEAVTLPHPSTANNPQKHELCRRCLDGLREWLRPNKKARSAQPVGEPR